MNGRWHRRMAALTAHYEHTVAITEDGPYILTALRDEDTRVAKYWTKPGINMYNQSFGS
jgi:hypothetical protein